MHHGRVTSDLFRMAQLTDMTAGLTDGLHGWPYFVSRPRTSERQRLQCIHRWRTASSPGQVGTIPVQRDLLGSSFAEYGTTYTSSTLAACQARTHPLYFSAHDQGLPCSRALDYLHTQRIQTLSRHSDRPNWLSPPPCADLRGGFGTARATTKLVRLMSHRIDGSTVALPSPRVPME
jgi:hypothetical protein